MKKIIIYSDILDLGRHEVGHFGVARLFANK